MFKHAVAEYYTVLASSLEKALEDWRLGKSHNLLALFKQGKLPEKSRHAKTLRRAVMLGKVEYKKFSAGHALAPKEPLQSWTEGLVVGTPYINESKPIYLMFEHTFSPDEIVLDVNEDFPNLESVVQDEQEIICKSVALGKKDLLWDPFIIEGYLEEDEEKKLMEEFPELTVNDPHST